MNCVAGTVRRWARRKTYGLQETDPMASHGGGPAQLAKVLNLFDLTLLGVGSTLGVGIYVLAGSVALDTAGPAVCISFLVAAIASAFAAMSYAEFGARVPKAGSAYIYSYVTVGEFIAFVIGWNLILEYLIGTASVARAFSANLDALTNYTMSSAFLEVFPINAPGLSPYADFFCLGITLLLAVLLGFGVRSSAIFTNIFTFVNITVVLFVIIGGAINADPNNWKIPQGQVPEGYGTGGFMPYGFAGVMAGAAKCFFAFVGFDSIAATGEEAKNAKRNIPFSINLTLIIVFFAYFGVSTVLTLMWPYYLQDPNTPLVHAFQEIGWDIAAWTISIGSLFGLAASLLGAMIPLPRIIYAKAKDGLVFRFLAQISPKFQTPVIATAVSGVMAAILGAIFDLDSLVDMMSIGTLLAYTLVSISVLILRYEETEEEALNSMDQSRLPPWKRLPTKRTSRNAIYSTVLYCVLTIVFCGIIVNVESTSANPWMLFGIGISLGPMIMVGIYLALLPRSKVKLFFKVPAVPLVPCLSVVINTFLMFKLSVATWIRFAVWMAIGFLMYFGYGMWNSSQEYVERGKIPPGGTEPLPEPSNNKKNLGASHVAMVNEASENNSDTVKRPLSRLAPTVTNIQVTSLDDDVPLQTSASSEEDRNRQSEFASAILESHVAAQNVFDEARREREHAIFEVALLQSHKLAEQVFANIRKQKDVEQQEMAKQMAALHKETEDIHQKLQDLFNNFETPVTVQPLEMPNSEDGKEIEAETRVVPKSPLSPVLAELKETVATIDADQDEEPKSPPPPPLPSTPPPSDESLPKSRFQELADSPSPASISETKPSTENKKKSGMPVQVLDELKMAISRVKSTGEEELGVEDGMSDDVLHSESKATFAGETASEIETRIGKND